jgi:glycosyltransferase involved in cell wall biosynthesis
MSLGTPVIAVNNGGPLETVKHNETGYLCEEDPQQFMEAMLKIATDESSKALGPNGIAHVKVPPALPSLPSLSVLPSELLSARRTSPTK